MNLRLLKLLARIGSIGLIGLFALSLAGPAAAQARFNFDSTPGSLPKTVVPSRYALAFDLDPARDDFNGRAEIALEVRQQVASIVLHALRLEARRVELRPAGEGTAAARRLTVGAGAIPQSWALRPADAAPIAPGRYTLHIDYSGRVNTSGNGLYGAGYGSAGPPGRMLATQLESTDARSVFPAFDEPAFRAAFEISVRAPQGLTVVSNMPQASEAAEGGQVLHRFQTTPPMPSYLVALAVGRFDVLAGSADGVPLRLLTAPGKRAQAAYAMQVTQQVVPYYNAWFGLRYALPKLDLQAVPSVREGAMEDWGLISYSEDALLYDPATSSPRTQRGVFSVVAHEIAHQWFGNLVTAASWDEIWLNEAFATWMAAKATAHFNPDWHDELERRPGLDRTMAGDMGGATRAIRSGPVSETAVFDVFDGITYTKGGAVLGMLEQTLGEDAFQRGLAAYMTERQFSNATAGDLWFHLGQASKRDVAALASSWTDQPGFPLVAVESRCVEGRTELMLSQRRMRDGAGPAGLPSSDSVDAAAQDAALWQIPVRLARGERRDDVLLTQARQRFELPGCSEQALVANAGGIGYYRVKYDAAGAAALAKRFTQLAPADQLGLLSDSFALAQAGELPMARWFALLEPLPQVAGPARGPLYDLAGSGYAFLDEALAGTSAQPLLQAAGRRLFGPELARLGWDDRPADDPQTLQLRGALVARLARYDDAATVREALRRFDADAAGASPLPASIRRAVVWAAGRHGGADRHALLLARLKSAGGEEERWMFAEALAAGTDEGRARALLELSLAGVLPSNIAGSLPGLVADEGPFGDIAYAYTLEHWDALARINPSSMYGAHWLLPGAAARFNLRSQAETLIADQRRLAGPDGAAPAARTAAGISLRAAVRARETAALETLLAAGR